MNRELRTRKNVRLKNYDYSQPGYYFVTICTQVRYENILCEIVPPISERPAAEGRPYRDAFHPSVGGGLCAAPFSQPACTAPFSQPVPSVIPTNLGQFVNASINQIPVINPGVVVDIYTIMPDHIHMVLNLTGRHGGRPLPNIIGRFKSYTDHYYRKNGSPFGPYFWQEGYYEHIIRNDADLNATREYIQNNPLKWILDRTEPNGQEENAK
ncbi:hypothetical protein D1641_05955 [Colidextribacter sp. OB.20]|uniref:transposase n=1 Tax=Colidextribacter sp. OB.20 TaxID=2304568 RepID=UPI0013708C8A|nr:transposase [Colidextribacter sp. OB.20]NBI09566.1 hypothetical protein [Colidextribacter sp. OB.20]